MVDFLKRCLLLNLLCLTVSDLLCDAVCAQEPARVLPPSATTGGGALDSDTKVERTGEHRYRIGEIEFDSETRELRLPAKVNMREGGPTEYLLVHEKGKVHEAILTTPVSPLHLQIALKLLRYQAGGERLFERLAPSGGFDEPKVTPEQTRERERAGAEAMQFSFKPEGGEVIMDNAMVYDAESGRAMENGEWIYTGSGVENGRFLAESTGSIVAIYLDPIALFNMTREGAEIDERWGANRDILPAVGTLGVFTIRLDKAQNVSEKKEVHPTQTPSPPPIP